MYSYVLLNILKFINYFFMKNKITKLCTYAQIKNYN